MRNVLIQLFLFLMPFVEVSSQTIRYSQELGENKNAKYMKILGSDEFENIYLLRSNLSLENDRERSGFRSREYYLQQYSVALNLNWEKQLVPSIENARISDVQLNSGRIVVVSYTFERKSKTYSFFIQSMNSKGEWQGSATPIDQFSANQLDEDDKPGIICSQDELSMAFNYRKVSLDKKSQSYQVVLLDTSFQTIYNKEMVIDASFNNYIPLKPLLSNDRNFYVLGIHYATEKRVKLPDEVYYEIHGYNSFDRNFIYSEIKIESKFLTDVGFSIDNYNHRVIAAGFYSDRTTYSTAGIFYNSFSEDSLNQLSTTSSPFPSSYLQKFIGERKENKSRELVNYSIDRLIVRRDGGVALLAESFNRAERSYWDYYIQSYIYHYYYHYGNIMVCSVNPSGQILWGNVISKDQNSVDDGGVSSGYISSVIHGKIVSVYNKYVNEDSSVLLTTIDGVGAQKTDVLVNENERVSVLPHSAKQIDESTILIPAYKQNKFHLMRISF